MNHVDYKYLMIVSSRLERFKDTGAGVYNFRCPFCGDSKRNKHKARGYILTNEKRVVFKCHNCGKFVGFGDFIAELDAELFREYKLEKFRQSSSSRSPTATPPANLTSSRQVALVANTRNVLRDCYPLDSVPSDLRCVREYAERRRIPDSFFNKELFAARSINEIAKYLPGYRDTSFPNFCVLVIPFLRRDGSFNFLQCRSLDSDCPSNHRFVTLDLGEDSPKLWGDFRANYLRPIYVLEGPIDAMFIENGVALAGATHTQALSFLRQRQSEDSASAPSPRNICFCYDNDYRDNPDILRQIHRRADEGHGVVLYDKRFVFKDINDAVKAGWSVAEVNGYVRERTFFGLAAKLELSRLGAMR